MTKTDLTRRKGSLLVLATLAAAGFSWSVMLDYEPIQTTHEPAKPQP